MPKVDDKNLVWLDLEMTGLEPEKDVILEIATVVTDSGLNILAEGPCLAVHQPDPVLDGMDPWCVDQHGKSGLTQRCRESRVTVLDAQAR
ncbi:MAG: oligoribonuclease, partial [Elusimicrobia bacterium]|nr:oligoribonuclease [Elusimicrobiota bacterium]